MNQLTDEQRKRYREHVANVYPQESLKEMTANPSLQAWWLARAGRIRTIMLKIDRDQMRSVASLPTLWVHTQLH